MVRQADTKVGSLFPRRVRSPKGSLPFMYTVEFPCAGACRISSTTPLTGCLMYSPFIRCSQKSCPLPRPPAPCPGLLCQYAPDQTRQTIKVAKAGQRSCQNIYGVPRWSRPAGEIKNLAYRKCLATEKDNQERTV